jgi:hypothetical protein
MLQLTRGSNISFRKQHNLTAHEFNKNIDEINFYNL